MNKLHIPLNIQRFAVTCWIECTTTNQSTTNNTSDVRVTFYIKRTGGSTYWEKPNYRKLTLTCDGSSQSQNIQFKSGSVGQVSSYYADFTGIQHNADGTKYIEFSGSIPASGSFSALSASGSATLNTIPRYTSTTNWSIASKTETSFTLNWSTANGCSQIRYGTSTGSYSTIDVWGASSGQVTISGLNPNSPYTLYFMPKRSDSGLWGNGSDNNWSSIGNQYTFDYPKPTNSPNFTIGGNVTINVNNPMGKQYTLDLISNVNGATFATYTGNVNGNVTVTPTSSTAYQSIPNDPSGTYYARVTTGSITRTAGNGTYSINTTDCKPDMSVVGYEDIDAAALVLTGNNQTLINGYSTIQVTIPANNKATPKNFATITGYTIENGSYVSPTPIPEVEGEDVILTCPATSSIIKINAIDSRQQIGTYEINASLIAYTPIEKLTGAKAERCDDQGDPNGVGEYVKITLGGNFWNNTFGTVTNTIKSATYEYINNKTPSATPTQGATILSVNTSGNSYNLSQLILGDTPHGFDIQNTYTIYVKVTDELSTATFAITLTRGTPTIAYAEDGVAIKKMYDTNNDATLQVAGGVDMTALYINGNKHIWYE